MRVSHPRRFIIAIGIVVSVISICLFVFPGDSRNRAEREHGIVLPTSANHIQCRGDAWRGFLDRGATTMFEMTADDLSTFTARLQIRSRTAPVLKTGDP